MITFRITINSLYMINNNNMNKNKNQNIHSFKDYKIKPNKKNLVTNLKLILTNKPVINLVINLV